jgi:hypothetical protein
MNFLRIFFRQNIKCCDWLPEPDDDETNVYRNRPNFSRRIDAL